MSARTYLDRMAAFTRDNHCWPSGNSPVDRCGLGARALWNACYRMGAAGMILENIDCLEEAWIELLDSLGEPKIPGLTQLMYACFFSGAQSAALLIAKGRAPELVADLMRELPA